MKKIPETLYHYTNLNAFNSIIESNSFHFTHYAHLNDPTEGIYTLKVAKRVIKKEFGQDMHDDLEHTFNDNKQNKSIYILSFSEDKDNLSMWRAYANNAAGITIGIEPLKFEFPLLYKIIYSKQDHEKFIIKIVKDAQENNLDNDPLSEFFFELEMQLMLPVMANMKHYAYKEEKEWRYILEDSRGLATKKINSRGVLVPYYSTIEEGVLEKNSGKKLLPIRKIGIGRLLKYGKTKESIQQLLTNKGYDISKIKFYRSQIPYSG